MGISLDHRLYCRYVLEISRCLRLSYCTHSYHDQARHCNILMDLYSNTMILDTHNLKPWGNSCVLDVQHAAIWVVCGNANAFQRCIIV